MIKTMNHKVDMGDDTKKFEQTFAVEVVENNYMAYPIYPLHGEVIEDMSQVDDNNRHYDWSDVA